MRKFLFLAVLVPALFSCTPTSKYYTARSIPIVRESIPFNPVIADVDIDLTKAITGTIKAKNLSMENAKQLAIYNALETSGADFIVDPVFKVAIKGSKTEAVVNGYYGKYLNVHKATKEELENLELYKNAMPTMFIPDESPSISTKKKGVKIFK